ncbi:MAG: alpha-L-fucosidase [Bacteroidales bacterium]
MNFQKKLMISALTILQLNAFSANHPEKGIEKLQQVYISATDILNQVQKPSEIHKAIKQLSRIQKKYEKDKELRDVISSYSSSEKDNYNEALRLLSNMNDAAKRLAMAGILQGGICGETYNSFSNLFSLKEDMNEIRTSEEGAPYESKEQRDKRMKWWRDGKFGMFVHYGLYSALGGRVNNKNYEGCVEWIQMQSGLDSASYVSAALPEFNPKSGMAEEWVKLAKESGCKYIVLTSRHHEGFNMFDTQYSDFNVKKTKGIDIIDEYAKACRKHAVKAGYYFSTIDWNHPDYDPTGSGISYPKGNYEAEKKGERFFGNHERYKEYLYNIFNDLNSKYKVDLVWWDFSQPKFQGDKAWGATRLMKNLFDHNPDAIQNNRLYHSENHLSEGGIRVTPTWKGDYSTAEHHVPATGIDGDWEACQTLNGTWGYSSLNQRWKSSTELIRELIDAVSRGGNFLLNIGPEPDGSIPAESIRLFREIGKWVNTNGEAIYETRANPFNTELKWGRVTRKDDNTIYLIIYEKPENGLIEIPCTFSGKTKATLLVNDKPVDLISHEEEGKSMIDIRNIEMQDAATVIKVKGKRIML